MKAIGYVRVSTTNQDVLRQTEKIKNYCLSTNYELVDEIVDFGISGATSERDGYKRLKSVTNNDADIIVISELSRLSRQEDIIETLYSIQNITNQGIKVLFLDNPSKIYEGILDIMEIVMLSVGAYGAAQERLAIKRRNQDGKKVLFATNPYAVVDGRIPYGFKKVQNQISNHPKYLLEINEDEATVIRKLFDLIMEGNSVANVMRYLYNTDIRHNDVIFTKQNLSKLFSNPIYKGVRDRVGVIVNIKPIVEPSIWDAVQLKIKDNYNYGSTGTTMFNPLRGIIRCRCGRAMMVKSKGDGVFVYRCSDVKPAFMPDRCKYIDSIRFDLTNEVMFSLLKSIDFVDVKSKFADKILDFTAQYEGIEKQIEAHTTQISTINAEIGVLQERYISAASQSLADKVQERIISKETELDTINKTITKKAKQVTGIKNNIKNLQDVSKDEDFDGLDIKERAVIFRKYIKRIQYVPVTSMQGFYKVLYVSGVEEVIAVKKTGNSPIFALLPSAFILTDNLKIKLTTIDNKPTKYKFDLSAVRNIEITIQEFFKSYSSESLLSVDLSYRNK